MINQVDGWNKIFKKSEDRVPEYDDWLDKYNYILQISKDIPVIDLGCGFGNDSMYLHERGYKVISCDFSTEALKIIKRHIPGADTRLFNILDTLPFEDNAAKIIISDLSIHYFAWQDTVRVINDIFRVLDNKGYLLCRVNSVNDHNYGAGQGMPVEENYYDIDGKLKRFFDRAQLEKLYGKWDIKYMEEYAMKRYKNEKIVWEIAVQKP